MKPRPAAVVRLGRQADEEELALGRVLEALFRLPSPHWRWRFLIALRDLYATVPHDGRTPELMRLFVDIDEAHARTQSVARAAGVSETVSIVRA